MQHATSDQLVFYACPGIMTDPVQHAAMLDGLPAAVPALVKIVQGNMLHIFWAEHYGVTLTDVQQSAVQIRPLVYKLARILAADGCPLVHERPVEVRLVGNCRDFSLMLCGLLRHLGIPARARCGFATYFIPGHFEDHWVCEYYNSNEERWVMVDPQLDELQQQALGIAFDPLDMPPGQFIPAGQAWQMCRAGKADPDRFGILDYKGWWFIWGNVVRDFLALNKVEILPWDGGWGKLTHPLDAPLPDEDELYDYDFDCSADAGC